jgi:site-specific DNA recombinase
MIAAIYARKSTDQNLRDAEKSVTRQVEHATAYAVRKGWRVDPQQIFIDDAVSGAEFVTAAGTSKRRGFLALMNALKPKPPFHVLIVMDQSRLGRSLDEVPFAIKRITDAGVRIFQYLTDTEVKRESASDKFLVHTIAFVDDMHREQARERTRDALRRKAERGHVAGGCVYGLQNVRGDGHVDRTIVADQAEHLRRVFAEIARGRGYLSIAERLNADGIPGPRGRLWASSTIRAIVFNDLYRGRVVYGRTRWVDIDGTKRKRRVPPDDWITRHDPRLQIIDDALWQAAHDRLARGRALYRSRTVGTAVGRPPNPTQSKYLLTGLLRCGHCGGGLHVSRQSGRRGQGLWLYYVCARQRTRGTPCPGALRVGMSRLDETLLDEVGTRLLTPERVAAGIQRAVARLATPVDARASRGPLARELRNVEQELANYVDAIGRGGSSIPALVTKMHERERRRQALGAELGQLEALQRTTTGIDQVALSAELQALCTEWRAQLRDDPAVAQPILRQLLPERLAVTRTPEGIRLTGLATYGPLVARVLREGGVPPGRFDGLWEAQVLGIVCRRAA